MRVAPRPFRSRAFQWIGGAALAFAILIFSPGVQIGYADVAAQAGEADFSWDPALEPGHAAVPAAPARAGSIAVTPPAGTCAAKAAPTVLPSHRALRGLQGVPLRIADGDEELNSLNGRGYNIGKTEPSQDLQRLMAEVKRRSR